MKIKEEEMIMIRYDMIHVICVIEGLQEHLTVLDWTE